MNPAAAIAPPAYTLISPDDRAHQAAVASRWEELQSGPMLDGKLREMAARAKRSGSSDRARDLVGRAERATKASAKVAWLVQAVDVVIAQSAGLVACKRGCAHCCHISVDLSETEARMIQEATGRRFERKAGVIGPQAEATVGERQRRFLGTPCSFLVSGACSIYAHRPFICRAQVNADDDDLLCRLVDAKDGDMPRVPYVNTEQLKAIHRVALGEHERFADIREWFPA